MATSAAKIQTVYQDVLANYLISMARTVENSVESALDALLHPNQEVAAELSSKVFLVEPRVNEMEILIDDHAVRMLRTGLLDDEEIRRVVATQPGREYFRARDFPGGNERERNAARP
jgi:uncharacterized protein with PhoU and TrkA domain